MARRPSNTSDVPRGGLTRAPRIEPEDYGTTTNRFWMARSSLGPKPVFESPEMLWAAATEYFEWASDNPLYEAKAFAYEGLVQVKELPKMRAFTLHGLCLFLDISRQTFENALKGVPGTLGAVPGMQEMAQLIAETIRDQKFTGAAADLLNAGIISRDIGLAEKVESKVTLDDERTPDQIAAGIESKLAGLSARFREDPLL